MNKAFSGILEVPYGILPLRRFSDPVPHPLPSAFFCCSLAVGPHRTLSTDDGDPYNPADEPYVNNISRGQICAFMTGFSSFLKETEVAVRSILHFMPGMRVAIATHAGDFSLFDRSKTASNVHCW